MDIIKVCFQFFLLCFLSVLSLLKFGLKVLKFYEKLIIRSTNVLIVLYEFSKFSECILCI